MENKLKTLMRKALEGKDREFIRWSSDNRWRKAIFRKKPDKTFYFGMLMYCTGILFMLIGLWMK